MIKIMIADDQELIRESLKIILKMCIRDRDSTGYHSVKA